MAVVIQQREIPGELLGELRESTGDEEAMRAALAADGYVLLRGALDAEAVMAARAEVFARLHEVDEIAAPSMDGIATGNSTRPNPRDDDGAFWRSVSDGPALRSVTHGERLAALTAAVHGEPACAHELIYLRPTLVGRATNLHFDFPFFAGFTERIVTSWIPFGDVPVCDGPLVIVENSPSFADLIEPLRALDFSADRSQETVQAAAYEKQNEQHPIDLARARSTRLLTTDFRAGDVVLFGMFTLHGSLDNASPANRVRLSCDVRWQPASVDASDPRYFGKNPTGSKGSGYADMRAARPMNPDGPAVPDNLHEHPEPREHQC